MQRDGSKVCNHCEHARVKTETLVCALAPKRMSSSKPRPYDLGEAPLPLPLKLLLVPLAPVALAWSIARFVVFVLLMCSVYGVCKVNQRQVRVT